MDHEVTIAYLDGTRRMRVRDGQTILEAAEENGVPIVSECHSGVCGTCVGTCTSGEFEMGRTEGLSDMERDARKVLNCQTFAKSDCTIALEYPQGDNAARLLTGRGTISEVRIVSATTAVVRIDASALGEPLHYKPGQFAQLRVPGTGDWRSYSYAAPADGRNDLEFIIRLLPDGVMSNYLRQRAKAGDAVDLRCSKGSFYLREVARPVVLMAGGTGLSAILAIAGSLDPQLAQPVHLLYGVTSHQDLCKLDALEALEQRLPMLKVHTIVARPDPQWQGAAGFVTELLQPSMLNGGDVDIYLCGPAAMVDATRDWLSRNGIHGAGLYYEKFVPSGSTGRHRAPRQVDYAGLDLAEVARSGRGTAVVIGGSIAGIAAAKVLSSRFKQVIVLEKDGRHHRREGRAGAAQGWHLHHLLTGGQRELSRLFPGIIDDMVREGAFKVDMADQYRLRLAGAWKKPCKSDVEIVCAGRPLLEWCVRRRLDREANVSFRYDSEVQDLIYDRAGNAVLGVALDGADGLQLVPAELVVDASGKSTRIPEILGRIGVGAPQIEQDIINCFYSTMQHRVPPERQWQDRVMMICYAYRPNEDTYAAQYYLDSSRTVLSTSLVAYNCYTPPRNDKEFREFARLMPSPVVRENIEGLEPVSQVYNFRYPNMQRLRYEKMKKPPRALLVVGDAYASADPVSGLGMTKALQEVRQLERWLDRLGAEHPALPRKYFRSISRISDMAWFVVREQNLRFGWIKDVEKKRPFYFPVLTWYMDRIMELVHDDVDAYRNMLAVIHLVKPMRALLSPSMLSRAIGKWAKAKLSGRKTLIERNFSGPVVPHFSAPGMVAAPATDRPPAAHG
ncbi:MAG: 2Fe-2S iron-sulfur cluster binding domain-containing protein [Nevskia sp.]|nr:2Fe-2S iron-sulfur cluster binding domain-containing protein [Nevskia sp.]